MELIEMYIHEVTRRIAKKNRQDIAMELRSTIEDMLPDNYSKKEIEEVLQKLGDPASLANQYEDRKQYLIGPLFYDRFINVLKAVALPIALLIFLSEWISGIVVSNGEIQMAASVTEIIGGIFITTLNSFAQLFFWITIVFVYLERFAKSKDSFLKSQKWKPEDLLTKTITPSKKQISKREVFFSLFWTVLWAVILLNSGTLLGLGRLNNGSNAFYPLFNHEVLLTYVPAILAVVVIAIGLAIYKLVKEKWTKRLIGFNGAYHLIVSMLLCFMASNPNLFNQQFIEGLLSTIGIDSAQWLMIIWATVGLTIVSAIIDVVKSINTWRAQ